MAKNALTIFDSPQVAVPDYLRPISDEKNIVDRVSVPSLAYSGKVWSINKDGEKTKITKKDEDGDEIPVPLIRVVVLDYAKRRGRAYYPGAYDPDKQAAPDCWSEDGLKPHPSIETPQHHSCEGCPLAVKGSKMTDSGKAVTACSQHRMLVVAPLAKLDMPLRMKIAITSDWDKQNEKAAKENWFAFNNYTDFLRTRNIGHTALVVTKMKFDNNVDYPKILFSPDRFINEQEAETVQPLLKSDEVAQLLQGTWTPAGVDGKRIAAPVEDDEDEAPKKAPAKAAPKKAAVVEEDDEEEDTPPPKKAPAKAAPKKAAQVEEDEDEDDEEDAPPPKKAAPAKSAPAKAAPKKAAQVEEDEDEEDDAPPPPKKGKAKAEAPTATAGADPLKGILSDWGEDD